MVQAPEKVNILLMVQADEAVLEEIRSVAPDRVNVTSFAVEPTPPNQRRWPDILANRTWRADQPTQYGEAEWTSLLQEASVIFSGFGGMRNVPLSDTPNLLWMHCPFAGVSNLRGSPHWENESLIVTTTRGMNDALPIAETVIGAMFHFAKRFHIASRNLPERKIKRGDIPSLIMVRGKTMGIVGLGGIGREVAQLAKALGMRVLATRRSAERHMTNVDGVDELFPTAQQNEMLAQCDFVAVCAMWTDETAGMVSRESIASMKDGAYLLNTARGEIIDEGAMIEALQSGKLGGAYVDVWQNLFQPASGELLSAPNLLFTPHHSGKTDVGYCYALDLFCDNLDHFLKGEPMENAVDWGRGY